MLSLVSVTTASLRHDWDPARVGPLCLVGTLGYLTLLERLIPYRPAWHPGPRELAHYSVYFAMTVGASALAQLAVARAVDVVSPPHPALPLWAEIPSALLLGSLVSYLAHRWAHRNSWLWRLHGVHHAPPKVNVTNNGVNHVLDVLLKQGAVQLVLAIGGFSRESVFAVGMFTLAQGYFVHANVDIRLGLLGHVLAGPEQHRLHHSTDLAEAGHYGSDLSVWDHLFGSFTWRPGRAPAAVGLADPAAFPDTGALVASLLHPWRRAAKAGSSA
ncbi:sterol desaturase family protein [Streptomyces rubradiris]|uniref:sterol desaturase family protein n=1 Tax=Streptomyces rubradiris TaxID=285531 RepID=UPI0036E20F0A